VSLAVSDSRGSGKRELGRGERILPGVFRLRLPLPWPGVPHCNAWAVSHGDGFVLFDTGMHQPGSMEQLERALQMCGLRLEDASLVVSTHSHSDHCGQAASIVERTGCEFWMKPDEGQMRRMVEDRKSELARRIEVARASGVPEQILRRYMEQREDSDPGIAAAIEPDRALLPGVTVQTDLGDWSVHETPGHAPNHVCLFQSEQQLLISGDHLLGRVSPYFDYGHSPDPVGEFLESLTVVDELGARLCLAGHGRTFTDVDAHVQANRELVAQRLTRVAAAIEKEPLSAFEVVPRAYDSSLPRENGPWLLTETLSMLTHLERIGRASRIEGEPQRWVAH
jgi:glyoxylase-like metal-dependent hydrolase (beta-lactamase superfamily II)